MSAPIAVPTTTAVGAAEPRARREPLGRRPARRIGWHALMIIVAILFLLPLIYMLLTSVRDQRSAIEGSIIPEHFTLSGYAFAWNSVRIWRNFINSVVITASALVLTIFCATLAGYAFGRIQFVGRRVMFAVIVSALFLPGIATLIPVYIELQQFGLLGGEFGLILIYTAGGVPFSAFLMRTFFEALPFELSEAGRIDGASELQVFRRIMLPLAAPGIATVAIFQMISVWNELLFASALVSNASDQPIQPAANSLIGQYSTNWPALTAAMTLSSVPMIVAYVVLQRWFVAGLTAGAVKS